MHELSICRGMLKQAAAIAAQHNASAIRSIVVKIGPLSGIEPQLLARAFPVARSGTIAHGAELVIELLPVRVQCERCGAETDAEPNRLVCGQCGDYHTRLLGGDEMLLESVELSRQP